MTMSDRIGVMNAGRLEQVGAPRDVYELPATQFVASFLGASNLLQGELEGVDGAVAKVRLAAGSTISLPAVRLPRERGELRVGVRPEKLHIGPDAPPSAGNAIDALVTISTYTGVSTSYECETADGSKIVVYTQNLGDPGRGARAGERVRLSWDPEHTFAVSSAATSRKENTDAT